MSTPELRQGDATEWLRGLPGGSVNLVITDPPYASLDRHRAVGTTTRLQGGWFPTVPDTYYAELFRELYRVLVRHSHCYVFSDFETAIAMTAAATAAGFKAWKPLVWDKCLAPDTLVWTKSGVREISSIEVGDEVATPGGWARVLGVRRTRAATVKLRFSDGTEVISSPDHVHLLADGTEAPADTLRAGDAIWTTRVQCGEPLLRIRTADIIPKSKLILALPGPTTCLWCGATFDNPRGAAAHQARFCEKARSKQSMAAELGIRPRRLQYWLSMGQIPAEWAERLGIIDQCLPGTRAMFQNDKTLEFPEFIEVDYRLGKLVGLYASQGFHLSNGVGFAFNAHKRDSHSFVARYARELGTTAGLTQTSENGVVTFAWNRIMGWLIDAFVSGGSAPEKAFTPMVYSAPAAFREGLFDGLMDGDGHFDFSNHRETFASTSADLAMFVLRHARSRGWKATIARRETEHLDLWRVRFDRRSKEPEVIVVSSKPGGESELLDIAIDSPHQFLLASGLVTHNCAMGMGYHYRSQYELILFFEKGKRKLADLGVPNVLSHKRIRGKGTYPTQKPVPLLETLVRQSSEPGELVVDPFCGSGSTGVAAISSERRFFGCDLGHEALAIAHVRVVNARDEKK